MRQRVNLERLQQFMNALSMGLKHSARVDLAGGASAVLFEWRASTVALDLKIEPEADELLRRIPELRLMQVEGELYKYPALNPNDLRRKVEQISAG